MRLTDLFHQMVDNLSIDEIEILNYLTMNEATNKFTAIKKQNIAKDLNLTESQFRKSLNRLDATNFIYIIAGNRNHLVHVTEYGLLAIQNIAERKGV